MVASMKTLDFPDRLTVELTNRCNVSCTFCPRQTVPMELGDMDIGLFYKIVDEASLHLPVKMVLFFRGESLLHPRFIECLRYAKQKGIGPVQFASNALALDEETAEQMLEAGVDFISFSLDTIDSGVYKSSRLSGDLQASMEHVASLSRKCGERKKKGLPVPTLQVSTIEMEEYSFRQEEFIDFWKQYVDIVRVYYEHDDKGQFRDAGVQKELERLLPERRPCRKVFTDCLIYWNGDLALCNYDWNGGLKGLNVNRMSIEEAWHSAVYEGIREMHRTGDFEEGLLCGGCQHWRIDYTQSGFLGKMYKGNRLY